MPSLTAPGSLIVNDGSAVKRHRLQEPSAIAACFLPFNGVSEGHVGLMLAVRRFDPLNSPLGSKEAVRAAGIRAAHR